MLIARRVRAVKRFGFGAGRGKNVDDPPPDTAQRVGQEGVAARIRQAFDFARHGIRHVERRGRKRPVRGKDINVDAAAQIQHVQGQRRVQPLPGGKIDSAPCRQLRFEHVGDQLDLVDKARGPLISQIVPRRVQIQNSRHQDDQGQQVEGDDLARKRRAMERQQPAPLTRFLQLPVDRGVGRDPIVAQHNSLGLLRRAADRAEITYIYVGRRRHWTLPGLFLVVAIAYAIEGFDCGKIIVDRTHFLAQTLDVAVDGPVVDIDLIVIGDIHQLIARFHEAGTLG